MQMLVAEDLLLLLLDDESGQVSGTSHADLLLGGAVLTDLALAGAVTVPEKTRIWHAAKVHAVPGASPEDPLLRDALATVATKERSAQDLVARLGKGARDRLAQRLVERGILARRDRPLLGLVPRKRWPMVDASREQDVRRALRAALVEGTEPDGHTGALVALLASVDRAHKTVEHEGLPAREVRRRAKQIAEGAWAAQAVRDAVRAATAATTAAVTAGAVTAAGSGS